jgi:hypothetical protein
VSVLMIAAVRDRKETDLSDDSVQALIDTAEADIIARHGPYAHDTPITIQRSGDCKTINIARPIDAGATVAITETVDSPSGITETTLADDDYRLWTGGRWLERLHTGTNPRWQWPQLVEITYTPVDDTAERTEVATKLVILSIEYEGVIETRAGDTEITHGMRSAGSGGDSPLVFIEERERLLESLMPRGQVMLR